MKESVPKNSSSLRIGWIFMAKNSMSKGEITRSYHFY